MSVSIGASVIVLLDGAALRVREANLLSILQHVARPLSAVVAAVWQGLNAADAAEELARRHGISAILEPDVFLEGIVRPPLPGLSDELFRTVFYALYTRARAYKGLQALEAAWGSRFDWVVYSRGDLRWFSPLPPAEIWANSSSTVWVPDGADWGGLYDRAAIMPRRFAQAYFERPFLLLTSPPADLQQLVNRHGDITAEVLLSAALEEANAEVGSFPPLAAVTCCEENAPECIHHVAGAKPCYGGYRHYHEFVDASHAAMFSIGGQWAVTKGRRYLVPGCFDDEHDHLRCCQNASSGCFDGADFYTARRCCSQSSQYLTIRKAGPPPCWSLSVENWAPQTAQELSSDVGALRALAAVAPIACLPH
eukprot:TRINITY_DN114417_c0_g1_i1.p1 TRINITY_DN114417_c0_g1~~TRINITY_DN114417_c0_g1_i1.p1  ORF type:complete len:366 (+),score=56.12 TRINITY_DN114417_c0_g1_i1:1-1098(+)